MEGAHCNAILENPASPRVHQGLDLFDLFLKAQGNCELAVPALTLMEGNESHHLIRERTLEWHSHEKGSYTPQDADIFQGDMRRWRRSLPSSRRTNFNLWQGT